LTNKFWINYSFWVL